MKDGKFENQAEIYQVLLTGGEKITGCNLEKSGDYLFMKEGFLCDSSGKRRSFSFFNISDWSVYEEPKEREVIELYETWDWNGNRCLCDIEGRYPNFSDKKMERGLENIAKRNIINPDKPTLKIYSDTFEIVREG